MKTLSWVVDSLKGFGELVRTQWNTIDEHSLDGSKALDVGLEIPHWSNISVIELK